MVHKTSSWNCVWSLNIKKQLVPIAFFQSNSIVNVAISGFHPDPPKKKKHFGCRSPPCLQRANGYDHLNRPDSIDPHKVWRWRLGWCWGTNQWPKICVERAWSLQKFQNFQQHPMNQKGQIHDVRWQLQQFLMPQLEKRKTQKTLKSPVVSPCLLPMGATASTPLAFVHSMRLYLEAAESNFPQKNTSGCVDFKKLFLSSNKKHLTNKCFLYYGKDLQIGVGSVCDSPSKSQKSSRSLDVETYPVPGWQNFGSSRWSVQRCFSQNVLHLSHHLFVFQGFRKIFCWCLDLEPSHTKRRC